MFGVIGVVFVFFVYLVYCNADPDYKDIERLCFL